VDVITGRAEPAALPGPPSASAIRAAQLGRSMSLAVPTGFVRARRSARTGDYQRSSRSRRVSIGLVDAFSTDWPEIAGGNRASPNTSPPLEAIQPPAVVPNRWSSRRRAGHLRCRTCAALGTPVMVSFGRNRGVDSTASDGELRKCQSFFRVVTLRWMSAEDRGPAALA